MASRSDYVWLSSIVVFLAILRFIAGSLPCVGDETRYAFQGVGLATSGGFYPQPAVWKTFAEASGCGNGGVLASDRPGRPLQTISTSVLYAAALRVVGLSGARWLNFIVGCVGLWLLYFFLKLRSRSVWAPRATVAAIALTVPFMPYLQLIYPEILLFTAISAALYSLLLQRYTVTVASIITLPFLHIRALPLALASFAVLLLHMLHNRAPKAQLMRICAMYAAGLGLFAASQLWLFGSLLGSAFPAYSPAFSIALERVGMQLYDVRHGAVAYTPLLIVAFAGLLLGALRRNRLCAAALGLFAVYFATFMWSTAQESWTGRFWVAGLPLLAIGLCYWIAEAKRWWEWLPAVPPLILSIANTITYVVYPLWFLESRTSSIPYAALFLTTHIHFGLFLPVDADPGGIAPFTTPIGPLLAFTIIVVVLLVWCRMPRAFPPRAAGSAFASVALALPFVLGIARSTNINSYSVAVAPARGEIVIRLRDPNARIDAIQFDDQIPAFWTAPPYPSTFSIRCLRHDVPIATATVPAHPLLILAQCSHVDTIDIIGAPPGRDPGVYAHIGPIRLITRAL